MKSLARLVLAAFLAAAACGCALSPEQQAARKAELDRQQASEQAAAEEVRQKVECLKTKKILNVRVSDSVVDFVLEDGTIVTFFSWLDGSAQSLHHHVGVR